MLVCEPVVPTAVPSSERVSVTLPGVGELSAGQSLTVKESLSVRVSTEIDLSFIVLATTARLIAVRIIILRIHLPPKNRIAISAKYVNSSAAAVGTLIENKEPHASKNQLPQSP
jgi:hypothetical protein